MSDQSSDSSMEDEEVQPVSLDFPSSTPQSEDAQGHDTTESAQQASTSQKPSSSTAKTSSSNKSFVCDRESCNSKHFATKQSLQRHLKSIHHETKRSTGATAALAPRNLFGGTMSTSKQSETEETKPGHKRSHTQNTTNEDGEPAGTSRKKSKETMQKQPQSPELSEDEEQGAEDGDTDAEDLMKEDPLEFPFDNNGDIPEIIEENWAYIRTNRKDGRPAQDVYNFRLYPCSTGNRQRHELKSSQQRGQLIAIFEKLDCRCKMNISFGLVLRHSETNELRYFHPSYNNARLFEAPFIIASRDDIMSFIDSVNEKEPLEFATYQRPNTKWSVHEITNMAVYVNKMPDLPIGCCSLDELPSFIKYNKGLHSLVKSRQTGKVFEDNLCFFRCLALHNGFGVKNCEKETKRLFGEYNISGDNFQGIRPHEIPNLEKLYQTNIMVYSIEKKVDELSDEEDEEDEESSEEEDDDGGEEVKPLDSTDPHAEPSHSQGKVADPHVDPRRSQRKVADPHAEPSHSQGKVADPHVDPRRSQRKVADPHAEPRRSQRKVADPHAEPSHSQGKVADPHVDPRRSQRKVADPHAEPSHSQGKVADPHAEPSHSQGKVADPHVDPRRSQRKVADPHAKPRHSQRKVADPHRSQRKVASSATTTNPHLKRKSKKRKAVEGSNEEGGVSGDDDIEDGGPLGSTEPNTEPRYSQPKETPGAKKQEQKKTFAKIAYPSRKTMKKTMYLNLYKNHFSYIKDFNLYSNTFCCTNPWCNRVFRRSNGLKIHKEKCSKEMKYRFPGSVYQPDPSIFDRLLDEDILVPEEDRCFPHRATFSFESFLKTPEKTEKTTKTRVEYKHEPLSVSVLSNVPGFDKPRCIISKGDPQQLVDEMIEYLKQISEASYKILETTFNEVFVKLDKQLDSICTQDNTDSKSKLKSHFTKLRKDFEGYLKVLPVLGFGSSKFDVNLVKQYLYISLKKLDPLQYVIKKNNTYLAIKTELFKFLDISNYLAQGTSSADFLKSYECEGGKGFFPFDWMDSLEKLNQETLPPKTEFGSKLYGACLSDEDYKTCTEVWGEKNMKTMREYLEWYSNRDLSPFMEAVEKMGQFYKDRNIDMFKEGISAPGLSLRYLFQSMPGDNFFTLIEKKHKDFYHTLKDNIVGGPSIVFHRHHEKGVTKIRGGKPCEKVIGYDANALYLSCLMKEMPVGHFIRRKAEDNFKPQVSHSHMTMAIEWLDWVSKQLEIEIQHKGNGREKRIGPKRFPVDGYCKETNTVYEFHGCYWHGHRCELNKKTHNEKSQKTMKQLREETEERAEQIRGMEYKLVEERECEWDREKRSNNELCKFLESRRLPFQGKGSMGRKALLKAICSGELFGFVECDINVPDSEKEKFSEMTPIFKNIDIAFEKNVIGDHMYKYAERDQLLTKPRRNLVGSMFGKKILLTTPLLKWYLQNGLEVTKIYQVIQYKGSRCFEKFGEEVSDARREGDASGSTAKADTMKLIGNSAYGKTVTNKEKFKDVKVRLTGADASRLFNDQRFRTATDIGQGVHEVELSKRSVKADLPLQIGLFVYQYAKLKMLQFYYEFLDKFIDRSDFQLCQMDTDSAYIAIAGNDLESVIKKDKQEEYKREKHKWFPRCDTPEHACYDKRTPGLFKVECEGDGIIALCSKTYICFGEKVKISSKGLNKSQNDLNKKKFLDVLKTKQTGVGVNRGYRRLGKDMVTYSQSKGALSYLYIKRKVADDGVTTTYLDI